MRKNRRKKPMGKLMILISSIIMLNLVGVSYAQWNDNSNMDVSLSTGAIEPYFIWDGDAASERDEEEMNTENPQVDGLETDDVSVISKKSPGKITVKAIDDNVLEITGWCSPGFNKRISLKLGNKGSIPIVYQGINKEQEDDIIKKIKYKGSNIKEDDREINQMDQNRIEKEDEEEIEIQVGADKKTEYGDHTFTYEIEFEQAIR